MTKKRPADYIKLGAILITIALFFTFFDVLVFSKISFLHESLRLAILIFISVVTSSTICIYLARKDKTHLYEKKT